MRVRLIFFALYRDLAGRDVLDLEVPADANAATAIDTLREGGGGFARIPARPVIAVNQVYASLDTRLAEGDELALLPPVAGG
jgi:molybdopterin synthase catalytic subunit